MQNNNKEVKERAWDKYRYYRHVKKAEFCTCRIKNEEVLHLPDLEKTWGNEHHMAEALEIIQGKVLLSRLIVCY